MSSAPTYRREREPHTGLGWRLAEAMTRAYSVGLRWLPVLYICWASVFGATVAWVMPPWQNADEPAHVERIIQIGLGGLLGERMPNAVGGISDPALLDAFAATRSLPFHADAKMTHAMTKQGGSVRWSHRPGPMAFPNTAMYPPFLYAAAVPAALIGRLGRLHIVDTLRLMRVFDAVAAAVLGALALAVARRTRIAISAILVLPMSLALAASATQDALLIPVAALAVALVDRARSRPLQLPRAWTLTALAVCLGIVVTAKPPYLPLAALPLLLPAPAGRARWWLAAGGALAALLWSLHVSRDLGLATSGVDPRAQAMRLVHHPFVLAQVIANSIAQRWRLYVESMVGILGWLDTALPSGFVETARWIMPLALLSAMTPDAERSPWRRTLAAIAALAAAAAVFLSLYLIWTPLRGTVIEGIQGRYFLPLLPALALGMPNLGRWAAAFRPPALLAVLALAAASPPVVLTTLVSRYYMGP